MARYIDAEELYKRVKDNVGAYYASQVDVKDECLEEIENMPTADVVPKSEVEELKVRLELEQKAHESLKELYRIDTDALIEARRKTEVEVAREIFEEIEKIIDKHHSECYEYEDGDECDTAITYISYISYDIAELKKKYTENL